MIPIRTKRLSRRTALRSAGVCLSLPLLDAMAPWRCHAQSTEGSARETAPAKRMVFVYVPNGVNIQKWVPTTAGKDYDLSPTLGVLSDLRDDFSVLTGLGHPNSKGGHSGADTWLTGADLSATPGYDYRNQISADQVAANSLGQHTRLPSLELSSSGGTGKPGHSHTLAFSRTGVPLPAQRNPRAVFERLFVDESGDSRQSQIRRFAEDKSVLDAVLEQSKQLNQRLGGHDQRKLEEYFSSVREVERRLKRSESWLDVPKEKIDGDSLALGAEPDKRGNRAEYIRVMYDLMFLAFRTDTTRVATFEIGREAAGGNFFELGLNANHHELSHHGGDVDMLDGLFKIDQFHLEQLAYFLKRLKSVPEGDGTLLDQTLVMYGSGMNSGEGGGHSPKNLPLLVAGGAAAGLRQGQHLSFEEGSTPLSNLLLTFLQAVGVEQQSFQDSTGTLAGLV